ncbi:hypothetical protein IID04_02795 [PVC group bacterium]|nr:hypothetical protein [PVC group bacterium]
MILYNGLVNKKSQVANSFAGIDALLKKRYDFIPNLVATVQIKEYFEDLELVYGLVEDLNLNNRIWTKT